MIVWTLIIGFAFLVLCLVWKTQQDLRSRIVHCTQLSAPETTELWEAFQNFFEKEFEDEEDFKVFLMNDRHVLQFTSPKDNKLKGFIIAKILKNKPIDGQLVDIIQGDFFAVAREYRAHSTPLWTLLYFCIRYKILHLLDRRPLYYFFVTYSYRSYLSFGRAMGIYWPCHHKKTPIFEKKLLDLLGTETGADWGEYDSRCSVIKDTTQGERGRLKLTSSGVRRDQIAKTLEFFLENNPGHIFGDCFCVCAPISFYNFFAGGKKTLLRALGMGRSQIRSSKSASDQPKPTTVENVAFGLGVRKISSSSSNSNGRIRHFKVHLEEEALRLLQRKLEFTCVPTQFDNQHWEYGTELHYIRELTTYWSENFDWRKQETLLNSFQHFKTRINEYEIHFIHMKSKTSKTFPLLLLHGWPSSFFEFYKVITPLTDPELNGGTEYEGFNVIIPSLPGYGFSEIPDKPGMDVKQIASLFVQLMKRLEYTKYGVCGGDWGALVASYVALEDPQHCSAIHLTSVLADWEPENLLQGLKMKLEYIFRKWLMTPMEIEGLQSLETFEENELGYAQIHSTKPQTLAYGLVDSPIGLAAWIIEKFRSWSDCNGNLESKFTKEELLTNIMIYWMTGTISSSIRLYYETKKSGRWSCPERRVEVPVGVAVFPREILRAPRRWAETVYNITRWKIMPSGGHWPALEEPNLYISELRAFFAAFRG